MNESTGLTEAKFPPEVLKQMMEHCKVSDLAMMEVGNDACRCLIIAHKSGSPEQASIFVAYLLLSGIVEGHFNNAQEMQSEIISSLSPHGKPS